MSYLSPLLTLMVNAVKKASSNLDRDFSEIERLQSSIKPYQNFVANSYNKTAQNLRVELNKVRPDAQFFENDVKDLISDFDSNNILPYEGVDMGDHPPITPSRIPKKNAFLLDICKKPCFFSQKAFITKQNFIH